MLVDIFARRYEKAQLRASFEDCDKRLLVQAFRILSEDIAPYYREGKESEYGVKFWTRLHNDLSRELGLKELSPLYYSYTVPRNGSQQQVSGKYTLVSVCETWMNGPVAGSIDQHIKERLSLVELGFRYRELELRARAATAKIEAAMSKPAASAPLASGGRFVVRSKPPTSAFLEQIQKSTEQNFQGNVEELNTRFKQAGYLLNYHNGFIQIVADDLVQQEVETPFWQLVSDGRWKNIDLDMKEALDLRDSNGRDPAWYAAKSLESAIKIISSERGWTHGGEKGAANYIENLASKKNGFLEPWEAEILKEYFKSVRNPFGHGPGGGEMPTLSPTQTEWAIEFAMSWIKALIKRHQNNVKPS
ncbi:AbiJ-NTD4 domain-containing protein [Glycocaulis sp.]|uniref:AbiJ-NTD4 domain-containing protein n=1 Tax=Glycocaulis sp. TaxID=1969725 RepID=UPI003F6E546E